MDYLDFLHGGNIHEVERKYRRKIIDFSANINPLGLPHEAKKALCKNFDRVLHYPDSEPKLIQTISKYWNVNGENILLDNGSVELIYLIATTFKPKTVLIPVPTFSEYERAARNIRSKMQFLKLEEKQNFRLNLPRSNKADITFICNPNNPTGNLLLEGCAKRRDIPAKLLVADEAFMDFLPDEKYHSLIWKAAKDRKIIVLRTFTKFFALPGLRIGYLIAHKEIINRLKQHQPPWNTNSLAQLAAEIIMGDKEYRDKTYKLVEKERRFLTGELAKIVGVSPFPSETNFILIKIENKKLTSLALAKKLIKGGFLVRDCTNFRGLGDRFIRIAVRRRKENLGFIRALNSVIVSYG